jgi:hypothetical protein
MDRLSGAASVVRNSRARQKEKMKAKIYNFMFWLFFRRAVRFSVWPSFLVKYQYRITLKIANYFKDKLYAVGGYPVDWIKYPDKSATTSYNNAQPGNFALKFIYWIGAKLRAFFCSVKKLWSVAKVR